MQQGYQFLTDFVNQKHFKGYLVRAPKVEVEKKEEEKKEEEKEEEEKEEKE